MKKALTVRVPEELDQRFTEFCRKNGYKKGGLVLSLLERVLDYYEGDQPAIDAPPVNESQKREILDSSPVPVYSPPDRDPLAGIKRLLGKRF